MKNATATETHITLDKTEVLQAVHVGMLRQLNAIYRGRTDAHGFDGDGWGRHVQGALSEYVVARELDCHWCVNTDMTRPDVGPIQVRSTTRRDGRLIIHLTDPDPAAYVLAIGLSLTVWILAGWITGTEAKQDHWWTDPNTGRPAYFIPQSALHPIAGLTSDR
jgi:hypothetical protein